MIAAALLALTGAAAVPGVLVERRVASMGTSLDVAIAAPSRAQGLEASEVAIEEIRRVEDLLTTWRESPLSRLNAAATGEDVRVGTEIAAVLSEVFAWARRTERAFDPTVAPLMRAWDLRGAGRVPSSEELAKAVAATGPEHFRVDPAAGTAARLADGAGIDEGAWGKGYALDCARRRLAGAGIANALIDLGGQSLAIGKDETGGNWTVRLAHPRERQRPVMELSVSGLSASTSGNSERSVTAGGRRIGHELDPRSGSPAPDLGSVTVLAPSALVADVLSTAFFVAGPERGLTLSKRLRGEGVAQEVLFLIPREDGRLRAVASPGFASRVLSADRVLVLVEAEADGEAPTTHPLQGRNVP